MGSSSIDRSGAVEPPGLLPALQALFESDDVVVGDWEQRAPGMQGTTGAEVSSLHGIARFKGQPRPWSLIRKALTSPQRRGVDPADRTETPAGINYWKREFCAYQSDLLDDLPPGLAPPRCYHAQEGDDECVL